jgi:hypothetical protein
MAAPTRYIALFGPRACGKTVYLGALYGSSANGGLQGAEYHVASDDDPDDPTHVYLARAYRDLAAGSWPPGTAFDELKRMSLSFTTDSEAYRVILPDVGGELTTRVRDSREYDLAARELKEKILREYQDYHGFLVFAPVGPEPRLDSIGYKWEVDALVQALKERTQDGGLISRPVAVVLSKWDLLGPICPEDADTAAAAYFSKAYPELSAGLTATCRNLRVFPISSTGRLIDGKPPVPLAPYNLGAPLTWLLKTSDEFLLDRLETQLSSWADNLFRRDDSRPERPTHFSLALKEIDAFLQSIPHGPFAERALQHRRTLLAQRRKRRARIGGVLASAVVGVLALVGAARDHATYGDSVRLMEERNSPPEEVLRTVDGVCKERSRVMGRLLGWWRDLSLRRDKFRLNFEKTRFAEIAKICPPQDDASANRVLELAKGFKAIFPMSNRSAEVEACQNDAENFMRTADDRRAHSGIKELYEKLKEDRKNAELAKSLSDRCASYVESHKDGLHLDEVQKIKAEIEVARIEQQQDFQFAQLTAELGKTFDSPLKCYQLCGTFLTKWPNHKEASQVRSWQAEYLQEADEQSWNAVLSFATKYPSDYEGQVSRCRQYLENAQYRAHHADAVKFLAAAQRGFDRSTYEKIRQRARAGNEPEVLETVQKLCREYLVTPIPYKAMVGEVESWLKWFDSWAQGRDFYVDVESVRVNRGSRWHYKLYWPTVWAEVHVNGATHRTGSKCIDLDRDERGLPVSRLGPFHWKWNDPEVKVELNWKDTPSFSTRYEADAFSIRHLNGQIDFDGGKIWIRLRCPEVIPPPLSPYKD